MSLVQAILTDRETEYVDRMILSGYSKFRADLLRKSAQEYCLLHGGTKEEN